MPQDLADFLDDLGHYVEQRITHLPPPLAEMLSRPDAMIPMQELLFLLDHPDIAGHYLTPAKGDAEASGARASEDLPRSDSTGHLPAIT